MCGAWYIVPRTSRYSQFGVMGSPRWTISNLQHPKWYICSYRKVLYDAIIPLGNVKCVSNWKNIRPARQHIMPRVKQVKQEAGKSTLKGVGRGEATLQFTVRLEQQQNYTYLPVIVSSSGPRARYHRIFEPEWCQDAKKSVRIAFYYSRLCR